MVGDVLILAIFAVIFGLVIWETRVVKSWRKRWFAGLATDSALNLAWLAGQKKRHDDGGDSGGGSGDGGP